MCGICGFVHFDKSVQGEDLRIIQKMNNKLLHRGPDAQDTFLFENVALGFTRLSIIGINNGMQPLSNEDGSVVLICNGEIFNYIELKKELIQRGHSFKTETDIEVIIHLYEDYGINFLNQLNGQFAFALYDKRKKQLICARDQMGIIPFFYTKVKDTFIFASEIKAILEHPVLAKDVNLVGLDQIFTFAGLVGRETMFKNIYSLENGYFMIVTDKGEILKEQYWDLVYPRASFLQKIEDEEYYVNRLEELLEKSIKLRLRTDVPYGLYLSGGLDSSLIAMKVNQLNPSNRNEAFSIDFVDSLHSESFFQKLVAQKSNSNLNQHIFKFEDIINRLRDSIYHSECPIKETYNTASMALSASVREKNIKVVLSGEGADEFFAGYVGYRFDKMREMNLIKNECDDQERELRKMLWGDESFYYEHNFLEFEKVKKKIYSESVNTNFAEINCLNYPIIDKKKIEGLDVVNKRAYIDYKIRLVDHLVSDHGDRMAMANSVEVRYPFLDKDLIEFSAQIPVDLKLNEFTEKYILRKVADRILPQTVAEREKFHFIAPGSPYILQKSNEYINDLLSFDRISRQGYFNPLEIENLKKVYSQPGFKINAPYENDLLITVITFGMLLDLFFED